MGTPIDGKIGDLRWRILVVTDLHRNAGGVPGPGWGRFGRELAPGWVLNAGPLLSPAVVTGEVPPASVPSISMEGGAMGGFVPKVGDVVRLDGAASPQFAGDRAINLRVIAVDTRSTYAGWLWLRGYELDAAGLALRHRDVFVEQDGVRLASPPAAFG